MDNWLKWMEADTNIPSSMKLSIGEQLWKLVMNMEYNI